jgi:hypothetical protein
LYRFGAVTTTIGADRAPRSAPNSAGRHRGSVWIEKQKIENSGEKGRHFERFAIAFDIYSKRWHATCVGGFIAMSCVSPTWAGKTTSRRPNFDPA